MSIANLTKIKKHYDEAKSIIDVMEAVGFSVEPNDLDNLKICLDYIFESAKILAEEAEENDLQKEAAEENDLQKEAIENFKR